LPPPKNTNASKVKSLPPCAKGGLETDFRWVTCIEQARLVAKYELAREIFLLADQMLETKPALRTRFQKGVGDGKPYQAVFTPYGWLVEYYEVLLSVAGRSRLKKFDLPPAVKLMERFVPEVPARKADDHALRIRHVAESYDLEEADYGPDAFFELRISRLEKFSLVQAVKEFERWARSTDLFDSKNPGGRPNATLLHLAYFRAMKGNSQTKLGQWFGDSLKSSEVVPRIAPMSDYGRAMYAPCMGKRGVSPGAWSDAVKAIASLVIPAAQMLVSCAESK
jgi:hypothetical protein